MAKDDKVVEETELEATPTPEEPEQPTPPQEPEQLEQATPEVSDDQVEEPAAEEQGEDEAPPQMSKRKAARLAKLENLVSNLRGDDQAPKPPVPKGMDYAEELSADEETISRLEQDRRQAAEASYNEGLERAKSIQFHTRLEIDAPRVESKYSHLNPESEDFNASQARALQDWYIASVGFDPKTDTVANPKLRWADFVDGIMELADSMAGAKVETTQKNIVKQAANTGIRPDGSASKLNLNKTPDKMTDDELSAMMKRITRSFKT